VLLFELLELLELVAVFAFAGATAMAVLALEEVMIGPERPG
jgi:hypothetical protein